MRHQLFLLILLFCSLPAWVQGQKHGSTMVNVSGVVKGPDGGIAKASVREIDANHRFFNQTTTDRNGLFSFQVRDAQHSLQFYAPGYRTISHKMLGEKKFLVTMEKRRTSPYVATAKVILKSSNLFSGRHFGEIVRQQAWIEKMCDTLFCLILPVEMERPVDEYPAGRQLIVLDALERQVMTCENVVDVYPLSDDPDKVDTYCVSQTYTGTDRIPGGSENEVRYYAYPHFQISRAQLEQLCDKPEQLGRLVVDTYRGDNYWNFFPTDKTISLFRKALAK
ncbi:MAG: carboxypeptidase regulatory-like domain-containing protein [Bacteroidaceae bacterium]|nr:carboxypeptidase regulatory-like domain-containing protein [Bacteroidaceae bacterium]